MATAIIDGIATRYELMGSGPPLLMFSPGGFNATLETWSTLGVYANVKPLEHLPEKYTCIVFDRRECGQSGGRVERVGWRQFVAQVTLDALTAYADDVRGARQIKGGIPVKPQA